MTQHIHSLYKLAVSLSSTHQHLNRLENHNYLQITINRNLNQSKLCKMLSKRIIVALAVVGLAAIALSASLDKEKAEDCPFMTSGRNQSLTDCPFSSLVGAKATGCPFLASLKATGCPFEMLFGDHCSTCKRFVEKAKEPGKLAEWKPKLNYACSLLYHDCLVGLCKQHVEILAKEIEAKSPEQFCQEMHLCLKD